MQTLSQPAPLMSWYRFPWDIRYEILNHLVQTTDGSDASRVGYTYVAREWMPIFERRTFSRLCIRSREMAQFHEAFLIKRRRSYLHHLTFIPDLPQTEPYPRMPIHQQDVDLTEMLYIHRSGTSRECRVNENLLFTKALTCLLGELTTWNRSESALGGGISLEILFTDKNYWQTTSSKLRQRWGPKLIWRDPFGNPDPDPQLLPDTTFQRVLRAADLNFHHYVVLDMQEWDAFAETVDVVSRLSISGQSTRRLDASSVSELMNRLQRLKAFDWNVTPFARWKYETEFYEHLLNTVCEWPLSLRRFEIRQIRSLCGTARVPYHPLRSSRMAARFRQFSVMRKAVKTKSKEARGHHQ